MLEKIKINQRITHNKLDQELLDMIDACLRDLKAIDINTTNPEDPLILTAVKLYCRWHNNYENEADRYQTAYKNLKLALAMDVDYV